MTRLLGLWAAVLVSTAVAVGQDVEVVREVGPDAIRQLAQRLRALPGGDLPAGLTDQIRRLQEQFPNASAQELAERLRTTNPDLTQNPDLQRLLQQYQGQVSPMPAPGPYQRDPILDPQGGVRPDGSPPRSFSPPPPNVTVPPRDPPQLRPSESRPPFPMPNVDPSRLLRDGVPNADEMRGSRPESEQFRLRQQQFEQVRDLWERNVGPMESTPAVRDALTELFFNRRAMQSGNGPFDDLFRGAGNTNAGRLAENALGRSGWKLDLGIGDWKLSGLAEGFTAPDLPSAPSGPGFGGTGGIPGGESWLSVILFGAVAAFALVLWWVWPKLTGRVREDGPRPLPGLGPWPVDPRTIADREALVKAFEYLSVLRLGAGARMWNHVTIAHVLRDAVPAAEEVADPLSRLYAVARYTPADEPLSPAVFADARRHLCRIAGVSAK